MDQLIFPDRPELNDIRLNAIAESLTAVLIEADDTLCLTHCWTSDAGQNILPASELMGDSITEVFNRVDPGLSERITGKIHHVISSGKQDFLEYSLTIGQEEMYYNIRFVPLVTLPGQNGRVLIMIRDITERVKSDKMKSLLQLVASQTADGVVITDSAGIIEWVNTSFTNLTGYTLEECRGKRPGSFLQGPGTSPDDVDNFRKGFISQKPFTVEILNYSKSGTPFWISVHITPVFDDAGKVSKYIALENNITTRILWEQKIQKSLSLQRLLSEISFDLNRHDIEFKEKIISTMKKLGEFIQSSRIYIFEDSADGMTTSNTFEWCNTGVEPQIDTLQEIPYEVIPSWNQLLEKDGRIDSNDIGLLPDDIRTILEPQHIKSILVYPLMTGDRKIGFIGFDECTEQRPWEEETKQLLKTICNLYSNEYERKLDNETLIFSRNKAEEASKAKETFLANMSHEIRTPLNVIVGMSNLLERTQVDEKQSTYLNAIRISAENLLVIINDILDISKIEAGKLKLEIQDFSLIEIVQQTVRSQSIKATEKNLVIEYLFDDRIHSVLRGDPHRLTQIFLNLLNNAVKFTEKGSVKLGCRLIKQGEGSDTIEFEVSDTGIGISKEHLKEIYNSFQQEDVSITRKYGGTGLGLAITKQLVELFHGKISVASEKNRGTTFTFEITLEHGEKLPEKKETSIPINDEILRGRRILLAEDNEYNRMVVLIMLEQWRIDCDYAVNGKDALEKLMAGKYDLILMDIQMPIMDGIEATHHIRQELHMDIPIIALTANALKSEMEKYLKSGMNGYISKPFQPHVLFHAICHSLGIGQPSEVSLSSEKSLPTEPPSRALYDLKGLYDIAAGNEEFVKKMIGIFIKQSDEGMRSMKESFAANDFARIKAVAHQIKPSINIMGIKDLKEDIQLIEDYAKNQINLDRLPELIEKTGLVLSAVVDQLKNQELSGGQ